MDYKIVIVYNYRTDSMALPQGNRDSVYWSNALGWVDLDSADTFSALERETLNLPMGGFWTIRGFKKK